MLQPTWEQYLVPVLKLLSDGRTARLREIQDGTADILGLDQEARDSLIPSGQPRYRNRAQWATTHLGKAGAVERPQRGAYIITDLGRQLLSAHPHGLTERDLMEIPEFRRWIEANLEASKQRRQASLTGSESLDDIATREDSSKLDPAEQIEVGIARIQDDVAADLLIRLLDKDPGFFERAVLKLLVKMGYGGAEGRATLTQYTNDGGIDGIIDQDALGLAKVYVQAKRYALDASIGRPDIQAFVGALAGNSASQGVFITTSRFAKPAQDYAKSVNYSVVLIDGERLARLMIRYGVGVQTKRTVEIVEIDEDFFE